MEGVNVAGYLLYVRQTLLDEAKWAEYVRQVGPINELFGGEMVARGAEVESLEGDLHLPPIVLIRFPSMERLRAWYDSPEYAPLKQLRLEASTGNMIMFEGA